MFSKVSLVTAIAAAIVIALQLIAGAPASGAAHARAAALQAPVIREPFTPLSCTGKPNDRDTLQQEGCAEQQILRTDTRINTLASSVFGRLHDRAAKVRFIAAQHAWLSYRRADCLSLSDVFEGGSQAPVLDAQCEADRNAQRIKDLRTFLTDLSETG
jgi:uncharacterized protein YecT (DUF1311 family)